MKGKGLGETSSTKTVTEVKGGGEFSGKRVAARDASVASHWSVRRS